ELDFRHRTELGLFWRSDTFMTRLFARRLFIALSLVLSAATAYGQTDYFWNPATGGSGNWDTSTVKWSTTAAGPVNYTWTNSGSERANFGNTAGTVTLGTNVSAFGINYSTASYIIAGGGNTLTLTGAGGVINDSGAE